MGEEHALVWTNRYGDGRVFASGIGHGPDAVSHPSFRGLFARGCEWAATGKVTLELPEAFGEPVPGGDWWPTTLEPMVRDMYEQRKASTLMATGDTVLTDDSLIRRPEGLGIALTVPWYRSLWLSSVTDIAVAVEGREIPTDDLRVELGERTYRVDELPDQWDVLWFIQDRLVVVVPLDEPRGRGPAGRRRGDRRPAAALHADRARRST